MAKREPKLPEDNREIPPREGFFSLMTRLNTQRTQTDENGEKVKLEWKDWVALFLSAFFTLFLPALLVLGILVVLIVLIFRLY